MKLETFFEKFDLFADGPDAVARMRELVLDLAVRGRLFGPIACTEARGRPQGWLESHLGDVAQFINGDRSKNYPSKSFRVDDGIPFINAGHLSNGGIDLTDMDYITPEHFDRLGGGKVECGDVLYCLRGSLGKCAVVQNIDRGAIASSLLIIRPSQHVTPQFIYLFLTSPLGARMIAKYDNGSAQPNLSAANVKKYIMPLPPLAEQKRIVAKVDELMGLCDRLEAQQQERETRHAALARASLARFADAPTPANLDFLFHPSYAIPPADLRKSILTLAVQGKLVSQDPNDEPAEAIISRVESDRPEETEAPVGEAELPWSLPSSWQWVRLGAVANIKHGYAFSSESFTSDPTQYVLTTPGNFYESGGFRDRGANTKYFNGDVPPAFVFNPRDLIIPMTEQAAGLLGSPAFIPDDGKTYLHNQRLGKLEFYSNDVAPEYVFWFFNSEFFRSELARTCTGMKVRHTSPKRILKVPIPLPPLAEQRRIVAKVEQLMALVDALETQLATARTTASNLLSAAVAELTVMEAEML